MLEKKGIDVKIIEVKKITSLTDYFINCSSESDPQSKAIKNHIHDTISKEYKVKPYNVEGYENLKWVLLDYITIVVNIFNKKEREYYNIERLWADAKIKTIRDKK
jgi:ribosome-associated protein